MTYRFSPAHTRPASRTRHQAVCADCGISTTLPFRPSRSKPVYCRPCFNLRRHGPSPMASTNGGKPSTASQPAVDSAPSQCYCVFRNAFEGCYQNGDFPDEHIEAHTHSREGHTSSHGGTRLDWPSAYRVRKDAGVRGAPGRAVRPVAPKGSGACAATHP